MNEKKIYRVYTSRNDEIHVECYPIVYSNDTYVYYKLQGNKELSHANRNLIHNTFEDFLNGSTRIKFFDILVYNMPDLNSESFKEIKHNKEKIQLEHEVSYYFSKYQSAKREYEIAYKNLEEFDRKNGEL